MKPPVVLAIAIAVPTRPKVPMRDLYAVGTATEDTNNALLPLPLSLTLGLPPQSPLSSRSWWWWWGEDPSSPSLGAPSLKPLLMPLPVIPGGGTLIDLVAPDGHDDVETEDDSDDEEEDGTGTAPETLVAPALTSGAVEEDEEEAEEEEEEEEEDEDEEEEEEEEEEERKMLWCNACVRTPRTNSFRMALLCRNSVSSTCMSTTIVESIVVASSCASVKRKHGQRAIKGGEWCGTSARPGSFSSVVMAVWW
jgi:hypothetical protein